VNFHLIQSNNLSLLQDAKKGRARVQCGAVRWKATNKSLWLTALCWRTNYRLMVMDISDIRICALYWRRPLLLKTREKLWLIYQSCAIVQCESNLWQLSKFLSWSTYSDFSNNKSPTSYTIFEMHSSIY
jgi:hypothetical protein